MWSAERPGDSDGGENSLENNGDAKCCRSKDGRGRGGGGGGNLQDSPGRPGWAVPDQGWTSEEQARRSRAPGLTCRLKVKSDLSGQETQPKEA